MTSVTNVAIAKVQCAIVVGVGTEQGIGAAVSRCFARQGLKVYVVGRTLDKLERVTTQIQANGGQAVAYGLDAENLQQIQTLFDTILARQEQITAVIYNVGSNMPSIFLQTSLKFFTKMWRSTFLSAYLVSQVSLKIFQQQKKGTLIFTGASASMRGKPYFAAFTMGKSALRSYVLNLAQLYKPQGVHIAHVVIDGMVDGDRINRAFWGVGKWLRLVKGKGGLNIDAIAENYWMLHQQHYMLWTSELDLRPYREKF